MDSSYLFTMLVFVLMCCFMYLYVRLEADDDEVEDKYRTPVQKPSKKTPPLLNVSRKKRPLDTRFEALMQRDLDFDKLKKTNNKSNSSGRSLPFKVSRLDGSFEIDSYLNAIRPTFYTDQAN